MTPILNAIPNSPAALFTQCILHTRVNIEQTFGRIKHIWQCLSKERTLLYQPETAIDIIIACVVLYNFGINNGYIFKSTCLPQYNKNLFHIFYELFYRYPFIDHDLITEELTFNNPGFDLESYAEERIRIIENYFL